jgi:hypothetical protein
MGNNPSVQVRAQSQPPRRALARSLTSIARARCLPYTRSAQVPDRESISDMGSGVQHAKYANLNYLKERDDKAYRQFADGKPDIITHTLAINIKVPAQARYIPPNGQGGVGLVLQKTEAGHFQVVGMVRDGPAHRSRRISKGDTLVQVNGQTFENHTTRLDGPLSHLSGAAGAEVVLSIQKGNGEVRNVTLSRDAKCFPDEIAFHVQHYGQQYNATGAPALDPSHHISAYVPPPVRTAAPLHPPFRTASPPHAEYLRTASPRSRTTGAREWVWNWVLSCTPALSDPGCVRMCICEHVPMCMCKSSLSGVSRPTQESTWQDLARIETSLRSLPAADKTQCTPYATK